MVSALDYLSVSAIPLYLKEAITLALQTDNLYLGVSPTKFNGTYTQVSMHRNRNRMMWRA